MTAKHTPGKWVWHTHDEETWRIYGTAQMRDGPADGCYAVADVINGNGDERQNAANRDLIAAAPALYEALPLPQGNAGQVHRPSPVHRNGAASLLVSAEFRAG